MGRPTTDPDAGLGEAVARARRYPFDQPSGSYLFADGSPLPLDPEKAPSGRTRSPEFDSRTAVLAYASNASPDALARKFGGRPDARIPVTACRLDGFEAVYSRHFYSGYIPATLAPFPGTTLLAHLTWLDPEEMELMNGSEHLGVNYELKPLAGGVARLEAGGEVVRPYAYHGLHGELMLGPRPIAVAGTAAENRRLPELDQDGILEAVRAVIAPELTLEQMVAAVISSPDAAARLTATLKDRLPAEPAEIRRAPEPTGPSGTDGAVSETR